MCGGLPALCGGSDDCGLITSTTDHEFMETVTNGWYPVWVNEHGEGIADKCGGYRACVTFDTGTVEVQPMFSNEAHGCVAVR